MALPPYRPKIVTPRNLARELAEYDGSAWVYRRAVATAERASYEASRAACQRAKNRLDLDAALLDLGLPPGPIGRKLER